MSFPGGSARKPEGKSTASARSCSGRARPPHAPSDATRELLDERRARARHSDDEDRQVRPRARVRFRLHESGGEDFRDLGHPPVVRVGVVGDGRALEPVALVVVAEGFGGAPEIELGLAEAEMQGRAVGERGPLARQQRLHPGDQRIAWLERLSSVWASRMPGALGKALAASSSAPAASALRPNSTKSPPLLAAASCWAGPARATARS